MTLIYSMRAKKKEGRMLPFSTSAANASDRQLKRVAALSMSARDCEGAPGIDLGGYR